MSIPAKITLDRESNIYVRLGMLTILTDAGPKRADAEEWVSEHFKASPQSVYVVAFEMAATDGWVERTADGMLAWMDLYSQGSWRPDGRGSYVPTRPREQMYTVKLYVARAAQLRMPEGIDVPFPGILTMIEGWASWDDVK